MSKLKYYDGANWKTVNGQIVGDTLPIGSQIPYGSTTPPANWLVCDGSAVSRITYADLFAVIGTSYGAGDGSTTFNLPNKKGRGSMGYDSSQTEFNAIGKTGGEKTHTLTIQEMPSHSHNATVGYIGSGAAHFYYTNNSGDGSLPTNEAGGGQAHNILDPYEVDCWIIKAFQSAGVVAEVENTRSESTTNVYCCDYVNNNFQDKPVELYSGDTQGNITLNDNAGNYNAIEVFYKSSDNVFGSTKIYEPNGKKFGLTCPYAIDTTCYNKYGNATINGTGIIINYQQETALFAGGNAINTGNYFTITKVLGYK